MRILTQTGLFGTAGAGGGAVQQVGRTVALTRYLKQEAPIPVHLTHTWHLREACVMDPPRMQRLKRSFFPVLGTPPELRVRGLFDAAASYVYQTSLETARAALGSFPSGNAVLQHFDEISASIEVLKRLKLPSHQEFAKNWDLVRGLRTIISLGGRDSSVMDAGCGATGGVLLPVLRRLGFKELLGCDLSIARDVQSGPVKYVRRNLEDTRLPSSSFDFIACLSVIEHGVYPGGYFGEMARLLRPGGMLLTSTDYWDEPINTTGIYPYGGAFGEMRIFGPEDIRSLVTNAEKFGLHPLQPVEFVASDKVVSWYGKEYTFLYFELKKGK